MAGESAKPLIEVDANLFRAANVCGSKEDTRLFIRGVRIEKHPEGGCILIATDGHRMIVVRDEAGVCRKSVRVEIDKDALSMCAPKRNGTPKQLLLNDDGTLTIGEHHGEAVSMTYSDYPDWRKIIPVRSWPNRPASFSVAYLAEFERIAGMLGADNPRRVAVRIISGDKDGDAALILFPSFNHAFAILMPMHADVNGALPAWMRPVMEAKRRPKPAARKKKVPHGR